MITDGHGGYLRKDAKGNFALCKSKFLGSTWTQRNKATNILQNCVNKNLRNRYKVIEIPDGAIPMSKTLPVSKPAVASDAITAKIGSEVIEENHIEDLASSIENFADFIQSAEQRKEELIAKLSDVDKEISDINHYIEFGGKFNAYQGWLAFDMLRNRLQKRRKIKDELHILVQLGECKVNSAMIEEIKSELEKLDTRVYQPRVLKQLFN